MKFPSIRPPRANYIRPLDRETLTLSPPGFSWWRAADRGACQYRVIVTRDGKPYYESPLLSDPIHHPDRVFASGTYNWHIQAIVNGAVRACSESQSFKITNCAAKQPHPDAAALLANVPKNARVSSFWRLT